MSCPSLPTLVRVVVAMPAALVRVLAVGLVAAGLVLLLGVALALQGLAGGRRID